MSVEVTKTGCIHNGKEIEKVVLTSENGKMSVALLSYGAAIQAIIYDGVDCVLGFDKTEEYLTNKSNQGAVIGRIANRVRNAQFTLNGKTYHLAKNSGVDHHSHGGIEGFDKKVWDVDTVDERKPSVTFSYLSVDGEEGYPGNLKVSVTYSIVDDCQLDLEYNAVCDADTPINFTNHVYFNLHTDHKNDILDTIVTIYTDKAADYDKDQVCTGDIIDIKGTALDFTSPKAIGRDIESDMPIMKWGYGHDHSYFFAHNRDVKQAAMAYCEESGITLECSTDMPAMCFYVGNYLNEKCGKKGVNLFFRQGFCFETNFIPNGVNMPQYPGTFIKAGEKFYSKTSYKFNK